MTGLHGSSLLGLQGALACVHEFLMKYGGLVKDDAQFLLFLAFLGRLPRVLLLDGKV